MPGPDPFMATLETIKDGQGEVSMGAAERVIILSAGADGQDVPQGAEMVVVADYGSVSICSHCFFLWSTSGAELSKLTWAFAPTATRARAARKNFMVSIGMLNVERGRTSECENEC